MICPMPIHGPFHSEHELRTYAILWKATRALAPEKQTLEPPTCLVVGVLCSFTLEAYLNHVGSMKLKTWERIERKLGADEKLELIAELVGISIDRSKAPFQSFTDIFRF